MDALEFSIIKKVFIADEGEHLKAYTDSKGFWTIGIGHLLPDDSFNDFEITKDISDTFFVADIAQATLDACLLLGKKTFYSLNLARRIAVLTLAFTLGRKKLAKFTETLPAIRFGKWEKAAELLLKTKWAEDVDPRKRLGKGRDDRVAYMLRTGEIHPDYVL